jgi:methionine sulfoxide reductase heme-binding subunit
MAIAPPRSGPLPWLKPAVFTGSLVPLAAILVAAVRGELGANPIAEALNRLGLVALIFLIAALASTPLRALTGWTWPIRLRRMLGLFGFFYALLHLTTYAGIDQALSWRAILADITKRRFIFIGFAAFVMLIPLTVTSTAAAVRRLGFVRWKRLHRLAYLATALGVVHFVLRVKKDVREPLVYGAILGTLLLARVVLTLRSRLPHTRWWTAQRSSRPSIIQTSPPFGRKRSNSTQRPSGDQTG